jgi:isoquinoline 1-oxidoreductase beta subunit
MEPPAAVARVAAGRCEVWAATQDPQGAQEEVATALGLEKPQVTIHVTFLGGGFGRKSKPDFVVEAALLAREMAAPVRVQWTRDDDTRHGYYHACSTQRLEAGLDAAGKVVAWRHRIASPDIGWTFDGKSDRMSEGSLAQGIFDLPLAVPNVRVERCAAEAHVRIGWLRSVANIHHAFAVSSFADELARLAKRDPLDYLKELLGADRTIDPRKEGAKYENMGAPLEKFPIDTARLRRVAERAAGMAGWGKPRPKGRGVGIACHRSFNAYCATVVEVDVTKQGVLTIPRAVVVIDCGQVIHPDRVRAQLEGAAVFGTSLAVHGEITAKAGAVTQSNFNDYKIARISDAPRVIDVDIIASDAPPGGVGETAVPPFAPALANAIHAATGKRVRSLPIAKHDLSWS